ncbi:unnamed protein product, partial [Staurois parvus]
MERIWSGRSGISTATSEYRAGRSALQRNLMEMTADLWGGGEQVPEYDRYPLLLPRSCSLTLPLPKGQQSSPVLSAVSGHPCAVRSLWSSLCCPQSLVIPVLSAVSGHPCAVRSLWSSLYCPQSLVIPCAVRSLWSSPVLCPQSLVISCTVSAVSGHLLYYVCS